MRRAASRDLVGVRIDDDEAGEPVSLVVEVGQLGLDAEPGGVWVGGGGNGATLSIVAAALVSRSASSVRCLAV